MSVQRYVLLFGLCAVAIALLRALVGDLPRRGRTDRLQLLQVEDEQCRDLHGQRRRWRHPEADLGHQPLLGAPRLVAGRAANRLHPVSLRWRQPGYSDLCDERGRKRPREAHPRPWSPRRPKLVAGRKHACDQVRLGPRTRPAGDLDHSRLRPRRRHRGGGGAGDDDPSGRQVRREPRFSPDGSSIVFTRFKSRRRSAIHRVNIDGTGLERLTRWRLNASDPDWSPDGQSIAFDFGDSGDPGKQGRHLRHPRRRQRPHEADRPTALPRGRAL